MRPIVNIQEGRSSVSSEAHHPLLEHLDGLYRFALHLTGNEDETQDFVQETLLRTWKRREEITSNARSWMFQTLYHTFVSSRRHRRRWQEADEDAWDEELEASDRLPAVIAIEDVRGAIEALPEELRAVVWLSDAEELHLREIAQILGWPIGTVASRLWRARTELRKLLSAYGSPGKK